jgi:transposase
VCGRSTQDAAEGRLRGQTDRLDARRLADALRRDSVVSIYVPPPAIRELREVCRGRHQVVRLRTRVAQMIRALLLRSGGLGWLRTVALPPDAGGIARAPPARP